MRRALGLLVLALILGGCEDGKPITPPPAEERPSAPPAAETPPTPAPTVTPTPPPAQPTMHGATGVGDTAPAPERAPPQAVPPPAANDWGKREGQRLGDVPRGMEAGSATDAGPR
jgi:hypothetical protein